MMRRFFQCGAISFATAIILAIGIGSARAQQGVSASISQADQAAAAAAIAGGHYAIELTPTREGAATGPGAFARLGAAANRAPSTDDDNNPFIVAPSTAWSPLDMSYHSPGLTITSWKQWNVFSAAAPAIKAVGAIHNNSSLISMAVASSTCSTNIRAQPNQSGIHWLVHLLPMVVQSHLFQPS